MAEPSAMAVIDNIFNAPLLLQQRHWETLAEGVRISLIYEVDGARAAFLHYQPGASVPTHEHTGLEHILILQGSQTDGRHLFTTGSLVIHQRGSRHAIASPEGCVALGIWQRPVKFI